MIRLILSDYLQSLKERDELDYLFPLLLEQMRYKVVKTAKSSHGQPEYGKDIIATYREKNGHEKLCIFQIKAGSDRDLDNTVFYKQDGVRESLLQVKDVDFRDSSVPNLNNFPKKVILVHNGELKSNFRVTFNGFVEKEFIALGIEFERWDIFKLPGLFSKYLLNEYLLIDPELSKLFKKSLAFLDVPEYDHRHLKLLVDRILESYPEYSPQIIRKLIATFSMISMVVLHYAQEAENLEPAKDGLSYLLLKMWGWILEKNAIKKKNIAITEFIKLHLIHYRMLNLYFSKTISVAREQDGLFSEKVGYYEKIGYPLRSLEYVSYLIYHCQSHYLLISNIEEKKKVSTYFKETIKTIVSNNSGCSRPLLDNHSIPIVLILLFFIANEEEDFASQYLLGVMKNIAVIKSISGRLPDLYNRMDALIEYCATGKRPENYTDESSYLLNILFEFAVILKKKEFVNEFWEFLTKERHLLTYMPPENIVDHEYILFQKELVEEGGSDVYSERDVNDQDDQNLCQYERFRKNIPKSKSLEYKTDSYGFQHLRLLAHIYFKTPFFPDEWRVFIRENTVNEPENRSV